MAKTAQTGPLDLIPPSAAARLVKVLSLLADARSYAEALKKDPWEFSISVEEFRGLGLTSADLRFLLAAELLLVRKGKSPRRRRFGSRNTLELPPKDALVILSEAGRAAIRFSMQPPKSAAVRAAAARKISRARGIPGPDIYYDADKRELCVDGALVKRLPASARNQCLVLAEFQERAWETRIASPLRGLANKARAQQLRDAVYGLNANQTPCRIRFHSDEKGRAIWYELP